MTKVLAAATAAAACAIVIAATARAQDGGTSTGPIAGETSAAPAEALAGPSASPALWRPRW